MTGSQAAHSLKGTFLREHSVMVMVIDRVRTLFNKQDFSRTFPGCLIFFPGPQNSHYSYTLKISILILLNFLTACLHDTPQHETEKFIRPKPKNCTKKKSQNVQIVFKKIWFLEFNGFPEPSSTRVFWQYFPVLKNATIKFHVKIKPSKMVAFARIA